MLFKAILFAADCASTARTGERHYSHSSTWLRCNARQVLRRVLLVAMFTISPPNHVVLLYVLAAEPPQLYA